ncbi:hypothetical protein EVB53_086 [Rhizobium phage RHph_Y60]|nr:hypothetical protein EVB53_086 [Rhizobium phage RHph_Y60]
MIYSVRWSEAEGYIVNGTDVVGHRMNDVSSWFRRYAPAVKGVVRGACMLSRMDNVLYAKIQRTEMRGWFTSAIMTDGTEWKA